MGGSMDTLEYQRRLAEFDEKISFHEARAKDIEHEKSRFVLEVLTATSEAKSAGTLPGGISVIKKD
jgi:hypothetical protein